jgi:hypothetical protein
MSDQPTPALEGRNGRPTRSDIRMWRTALLNGWPVRPEMREAVLDVAAGLLDDSECPPELRLKAAKLIQDADKITLDAMRVRMERKRIEATVAAALDKRSGDPSMMTDDEIEAKIKEAQEAKR